MSPDPSSPEGKSVTDASVGGASTEMHDLSREECLELLASHSFGRLVVTGARGNPPIIRPVNYVFDERSQSVVFRTAAGSKLYEVLRSIDAAFEIDGIDQASRTGWSVIIHGVTNEITSAKDIRRLEGLGLNLWAPGDKPHWLHIRAWTVSGRRLALAAGRAPGAAT